MYELTYIISQLSTEIDASSTAGKVREQIAQLNGQIKKESIGEKKKLSFPIKKQSTGFYATAKFELEPEKIDELNNYLRLNNEILRHLIINLAELKTEKPGKQPVDAKTAVNESSLAAAIKPQPGKVKIEELDKKLEELLK